MKMKIKLIMMFCILGTSLLVSTNVFAENNININRLAGQDRYGTSNAIVSQGWTQSNYAVLVNSQNFPDAITSSPLAKKYNAPILLTDSNSLTNSTKEKLQSLGVKNVIIIGGTGVVSGDVENTLKNMGISVKRIWGQNRYETSVNVAKELGSSKGVFIVNGEHYEDALSAAPIAAKLQYPIMLVGKDTVPDTVKNYVNNEVKANNGEVAVIGGQDVLTDNVANTLNPTKVYNQATKYDRNLALITSYKEQLDLSKVYAASDKGFADALSGSALAGQNGNPIILVSYNNQSNVNNFISTNKVSNVNVLGGTGVLSERVVNVITGNASADNIVRFNDETFEKEIREAIKKPTGNICKSDVDKFGQLTLVFSDTSDSRYINKKITDISGIENFTNLEEIDLTGNAISDLTPLKGLTKLKKLRLVSNQVTETSALKELTNLQSLYLNNNKINNISGIENLTNLTDVELMNNQIRDISGFEKLTNLKNLSLYNNQVVDADIQSLTKALPKCSILN